jgi:hypothetical protein
MSISSLRWRAASALLAAGAAAAAVLGLAVPAGASTGTAQISPEQAGYTATGAQFKRISAEVYLRQPGQFASEVASFGHSIQLWSSDLVVTFGVRPSTSGVTYTPYATIYNRGTHAVIASNPNAVYCTDDPRGCSPGTGPFNPDGSGLPLEMRIYYDPADGQVWMFAEQGDSVDFTATYTATGQSFTQARVGTEFGSSPWDGSYSYTPPGQAVKVEAYRGVQLVTYSGHASTLWSWWTHHKLLANTGQQSGADWVAIPTDLTNDGANFVTWFVPQSGQRPAQPVLH